MRSKIVFGTDGWRGSIAEDYTFENVRRCTKGFVDYLIKKGKKGTWIVVGYDKRFLSEFFAQAVCEILVGNGFNAFLTDGPTPTPVIAYAVVDKKAAGAVNITASHNPPVDNGFKVRDENGGAIPPDNLKMIESLIPETDDGIQRIQFKECLYKGRVIVFDASINYIAHLADLIDLQPIKNAGLKIEVDAMWGNGAGWFTKLLAGGSTKVVEIHDTRNPIFPEMLRPEPIQPNIDVGLAATVANHADVLLITDGDADRLGLGDENGVFINQLQVFALLAYYMLEVRGERGPIVKTLSTTSMLEKLGKLYNVPVYETGVGFKNPADMLLGETSLNGMEFLLVYICLILW
jgi:phosphomannomutase